MARRCENCIHEKKCIEWLVETGASFVNADMCKHYTTDVVPKSEVASGVLTTDNPTLADVIKHYQKVYAREIFEEIEKLMSVNYYQFCDDEYNYYGQRLADDIAELKKEYTEREGKG